MTRNLLRAPSASRIPPNVNGRLWAGEAGKALIHSGLLHFSGGSWTGIWWKGRLPNSLHKPLIYIGMHRFNRLLYPRKYPQKARVKAR
jgi:hypothetical protein